MNKYATLLLTILLLVSAGMAGGALQALSYNKMDSDKPALEILDFAVATTVSLLVMSAMFTLGSKLMKKF